MRLTEIKEKVGSLERALERDIAKPSSSSRASGQQGFIVDDIDYELADELDPWPSSYVSVDTAYGDDTSEGIEDVLDLGIQVGRMRITDRIGGLSRPQLSEEVSNTYSLSPPLLTAGFATEVRIGVLVSVNGNRNGSNESGPLLTPKQILSSIGPRMPPAHTVDPAATTANPQSWTTTSSPDGSVPDFMQPGPTYIQPSTGLIFGHSPHNPSPQLDLLLPPRATCDQLMDQYFRAVHPVARCVHKPSFREDYLSFWDEVCSNVEPRASTQALMFAVMFSAAASLDEEDAIQRFGLDRQVLVNNLKLAAETALCKASFLRTTRTETVQALIIYLVR